MPTAQSGYCLGTELALVIDEATSQRRASVDNVAPIKLPELGTSSRGRVSSALEAPPPHGRRVPGHWREKRRLGANPPTADEHIEALGRADSAAQVREQILSYPDAVRVLANGVELYVVRNS
jgi:hypothetical protein